MLGREEGACKHPDIRPWRFWGEHNNLTKPDNFLSGDFYAIAMFGNMNHNDIALGQIFLGHF